jgi:hypothetical protein
MMLQLYSMPLIAYGVGCWLMSRLQGWAKLRNALLALAVFFAAELGASVRFSSLFDGPFLSVALWFGGFALSTGALVVVLAVNVRTSLWNRAVPRAFALEERGSSV